MMHNTYTSSVISLRTSSFSCNNSSYYSNERCPSSCCSCCCSFPVNSSTSRLLVPLNPSLLYGLRQSTLIQLAPSRRLVIGGLGDRYCYRSPSYNVGRVECGESCCVEARKERVDGVLGRSCKERYGRSVIERNVVDVNKIRGRVGRRSCRLRAFREVDVEAMLSLLSEESVEKCLSVTERKRSSAKERKVVESQNVAREDRKGRKENVGNVYVESEAAEFELDYGRGRSREEDRVRRDEMEALSREEDRRSRRRESTSSYYSLSDSGDFESDVEVEVKDEGFKGESLMSERNDSHKIGGIVISEETEKDSKSYRDERNQHLQISRHDSYKVGTSAEWDCRKKSEKKLAESAEETKSRKDSVFRQSQLFQAHESSSTKASSSRKKFNHEEAASTTAVGFYGQSQSHVKTGDQTIESSKSSSRYEQSTQTNRNNAETSTQRRSNEREGGGMLVGQSVQGTGCQYCKTCGGALQQNMKPINSQQRAELSEFRDDARWTSARQNQSEHMFRKQEKSSSSHQSSGREENKQHDQMNHLAAGQFSTGKKSQYRSETVDSHDTYAESRSRSQLQSEMRMKNLEETSTSVISRQEIKGLQEKSGGKVIEEMDSSKVSTAGFGASQVHSTNVEINRQSASTQRKSEHYSETVDTHITYVGSSVRSQQQSETRMKNMEETSASVISRQEGKRLREESAHKVIKDIESSKVSKTGLASSQVHSGYVDINRRSASEQQIYEEQSHSTSKLKSVEEAVEKRKQIDETILRSTIRNEVQGPILQEGLTQVSSGEATITQPPVTLISQTGVQHVSQVESKTDIHVSMLSPSYQFIGRPLHSEPSISIVRNDSGSFPGVGGGSTYMHPQSTIASSSGEATMNQPSVTSISQTEVQQVSQEQGQRNLQISMVSPSYQFVERNPYSEPSTSSMGSGSRIVTDAGSSTTCIYPQAIIGSSSIEGSGSGSTSYEEPSQDALGSATRMEESSSQVVGEFVEKMRNEASTSDACTERKSSLLDAKHEDERYVLEGSSQSDYEKTRLQKQQSKRSSRGTGGKGPSDEMWDVKDHFPAEPSEVESSLGATSDNVVARSGKSLWSIVGGLFRLRWGSQSETQKSPVNSPHESPTGETWFSENEADEGNGDSLETEQTSMPPEPISSEQPVLRRSTTRNQKEDSTAMSSDSKSKHVEVGASSNSSDSSKTKQTSMAAQPVASDQSLLRKKSARSQKEDIRAMSSDGKNKYLQVGASSYSSVLQIGLLSGGAVAGASSNLTVNPSLDASVPPPRRLKRSDAFEETVEAGQDEAVVRSSREQKEQPLDVRQTGVSASEVTDVDLKRRKLQRSKQVLQERFDEWEDAYRLQNEQRKVDEIFMREALVEAKKAADSWEVPVGAVLVQNGNIIARGYNLVEQLRDSTAHAEMICIREASSTLRTWRLSETTLYVTLEPCPMCAGAILRARIGSLVWVAPNKLLGADGSWIRLFPDGVEGEERPEVTDKPAAPVHPFHPKMKIRRGVLEAECADIMQQFFQLRRKKEKEKSEEPGQPSCLPVPHHPSKLLNKMHGIFHIMFCL